MTKLASFRAFAPIREKREIFTETHPTTGIVTYEQWRKDSKLDRADGPAVIERNAQTGTLTGDCWYKDDKEFHPSPDVRAAWLAKETQENAERIARIAASSAPVPPAPM
jgi:hypothetical protein